MTNLTAVAQPGLLAKQVFAKLAGIKHGNLIWHDQDKRQFGHDQHPLSATVTVHNRAFYRKFVWRGSLGAAESYIEGDWSCDNLTKLMQIIIENETVLNQLEKGLSIIGHTLRLIKHVMTRNPVKRNRKNILYHYDLSNDFFKLFLDKNMQYSCAVFQKHTNDLDQAQQHKLKTICEKLQLKPTDHLLEIGTGWGGLAIYAAQKYGCRVTTTTISDAQYDYVHSKIQALQLTDKITLLKQDYRHLSGQYDKLVSIEMIESIGYQYFNKYFAVCNRLLKPKGLFFLQSITINDAAYDRYKREVDFIKAYIFPGGCLPCIHTIANAVKQKTDLSIKEITDIGQDYAKTIAIWEERFMQSQQYILNLGFSQQFIRLFQFYFCYCQAGFLCSYISDVHVVMEKR